MLRDLANAQRLSEVRSKSGSKGGRPTKCNSFPDEKAKRKPPFPFPISNTTSTLGDSVAARDDPDYGDDVVDSDDPFAHLEIPESLDRRPGQPNETTPPNLLADREKAIKQVMGFHIARGKAELLVDGSYKILGWRGLQEILAEAKTDGADRDRLESRIVSAKRAAKREASSEAEAPAANIETDDANAWGEIRKRLRAENGESNFQSLIKPLRLVEVNGVSIRLTAESLFMADHTTKQFGDRLTELWRERKPNIETVTIEARA